MSAWTARARDVANLARLSSPKSPSTPQSASLIQRRGLAGGGAGDQHGSQKVNFWEDPLRPSKWKQDHVLLVSLTGGILLYGGYMYYTGGGKNGEKKQEGVAETSQ